MDIITINGFDFYSYATVAQADEYFSAKFGSEWANIDEEDKKKLLVTATREIENLCFQGVKIDKEQPLKFPRKICCLEIEADNPKIIACCAEIANAFYNTSLPTINIPSNIEPNMYKMIGRTSFSVIINPPYPHTLNQSNQISHLYLH